MPAPDVAARRALAVTVFVGAWMALGWALGLDANGYLLLGIPLTLLFQLGVRRRPVRELWVRSGAPFAIPRAWAAAVAVLAILPLAGAVSAGQSRSWLVMAWSGCAVLGAFAAGYALSQQSRSAMRRAAGPALLAVLIYVALAAAAARVTGYPAVPPASALPLAGADVVDYFCALFVLEEVTFRGALDTYVAEAAVGRRGAVGSAILVAALWGAWHLPVLAAHPREVTSGLAATLVISSVLYGVPLAFAWRHGGTLVLPALAHALIDAWRNALLR